MKEIVLKVYKFDEYSMDSEEDIRDWYMSYINEMRNKYGGK